jgi:hypothetical protein
MEPPRIATPRTGDAALSSPVQQIKIGAGPKAVCAG